MTGASRKIWILIYPHPSDAREPQKNTPFPFFLFRRQRVSKGVRSFDFYYLVPPRWRFRFRLREAIHGGGWRSRLPVVQKAAGSACAKRFAAAAGAAGFSLFKKAVDSARAKRFTAAGAAGFPLFKEAVGSASAKRFAQAAGAAGFPLLKEAAGSACAKRFTAGAGAAGFPLLKRLPVSAARRDSRRRLAQQASHC